MRAAVVHEARPDVLLLPENRVVIHLVDDDVAILPHPLRRLPCLVEIDKAAALADEDARLHLMRELRIELLLALPHEEARHRIDALPGLRDASARCHERLAEQCLDADRPVPLLRRAHDEQIRPDIRRLRRALLLLPGRRLLQERRDLRILAELAVPRSIMRLGKELREPGLLELLHEPLRRLRRRKPCSRASRALHQVADIRGIAQDEDHLAVICERCRMAAQAGDAIDLREAIVRQLHLFRRPADRARERAARCGDFPCMQRDTVIAGLGLAAQKLCAALALAAAKLDDATRRQRNQMGNQDAFLLWFAFRFAGLPAGLRLR